MIPLEADGVTVPIDKTKDSVSFNFERFKYLGKNNRRCNLKSKSKVRNIVESYRDNRLSLSEFLPFHKDDYNGRAINLLSKYDIVPTSSYVYEVCLVCTHNSQSNSWVELFLLSPVVYIQKMVRRNYADENTIVS